MQLREQRHCGCVSSKDYLMSWAKLHVSWEDREIRRVPSYCEITVLCTALMQSYLGCCEQFGCLTIRKLERSRREFRKGNKNVGRLMCQERSLAEWVTDGVAERTEGWERSGLRRGSMCLVCLKQNNDKKWRMHRNRGFPPLVCLEKRCWKVTRLRRAILLMGHKYPTSIM